MYQCITSNLCIHHTRSWRRSRCLRSRDSIGRWKKQWKRRSAELGAEKTGRFPWRFRKETMRIYGDSPWESMGIYGDHDLLGICLLEPTKITVLRCGFVHLTTTNATSRY